MAAGGDRADLLIDAIADSLGRCRDGLATAGGLLVAGWTLREVFRFVRCSYEHFAGAVRLRKRLNSYGHWAGKISEHRSFLFLWLHARVAG